MEVALAPCARGGPFQVDSLTARITPRLLEQLGCAPWDGLEVGAGDRAVWLYAEPWMDQLDEIVVDCWVVRYLRTNRARVRAASGCKAWAKVFEEKDEEWSVRPELRRESASVRLEAVVLLKRLARRLPKGFRGLRKGVAFSVRSSRKLRRFVCLEEADELVVSPVRGHQSGSSDQTPVSANELLHEVSCQAFRMLNLAIRAREVQPGRTTIMERPMAILVHGPTDSGKTHLMEALGKLFEAHEVYCQRVRCRELVLNTALRLSASEDDVFEQLLGCVGPSPNSKSTWIMNNGDIQATESLMNARSVILVDDFDVLVEDEGMDDTLMSAARQVVLKHLDALDPDIGPGLAVIFSRSDLKKFQNEDDVTTLRHPGRYDWIKPMPRPGFSKRMELMQMDERCASAASGCVSGVAHRASAFRSLLKAAGHEKRIVSRALERASRFATNHGGGLSPTLQFERSEQDGTEPSETDPERWGPVARGCRRAKYELEKAVLWPVTRRPAFDRFKLNRPSGILLHGPPGCGKTTLGRAVARVARASLCFVSSSELRREHLGESEQLLRELFAAARQVEPCVVFLDEIDSIALARGADSDGGSLTHRLVTTLLVEIDGGTAKAQHLIVLAATNRINLLDRALLRSGRFEIQIKLPAAPDEQDRRDILDNLLTVPCPEHLLQATEGLSNAQLAALVREAALQALDECYPEPALLSPQKLLSGLDNPGPLIQRVLDTTLPRIEGDMSAQYSRGTSSTSVQPRHLDVLSREPREEPVTPERDSPR